MTIQERLWELEKCCAERRLDAWASIAHDARVEIDRLHNEIEDDRSQRAYDSITSG